MIENKFLYFLTYSDFKNKLDAGLINENSIAFIEDLSLIWTHGNEFGNSTLINLNEEDLAIVNDKIQFADKDFDPSVFSGLGRKYLRKNIVSRRGDDSSSDDSSSDDSEQLSDFINLLDDTMVNTSDTVYVVLYDYDLDGAILAIPENCVLRFDGGSIFNGTLIGQNTLVIYGKHKDECFKNVQLLGTWASNDGPDLPIYAGSGDASLALNATNNVASGANSVAEGSLTTASGRYSHAEGYDTASSSAASHAEGSSTKASGQTSHAEGEFTLATGTRSHAEGYSTTASGYASHAEGLNGSSVGETSHSEGKSSSKSGITTSSSQADVIAARSRSSFGIAYGTGSHNEGNNTVALGDYSHAEGEGTNATGQGAHSEGKSTNPIPEGTIAANLKNKWDTTKFSCAWGLNSHAEGKDCLAEGDYSHSEGKDNLALGECSHAEGERTNATGQDSHAEGKSTVAYGDYAHAEGYQTTAKGDRSHSEGNRSTALSNGAHAEGYSENKAPDTITAGTISDDVISAWMNNKFSLAQQEGSHVEGENNLALGNSSHAEGEVTRAIGNFSHAEGYGTMASGNQSHAECNGTTASGSNSHAEGNNTSASGQNSHAEGDNNEATNPSEHAEGQFNKSNTGTRHSVGIGTNSNDRKNAFEIMSDGKAFFYNIGNYNGTNPTNAESIQTVISALINSSKSYTLNLNESGTPFSDFVGYIDTSSVADLNDSEFLPFVLDVAKNSNKPKLIVKSSGADKYNLGEIDYWATFPIDPAQDFDITFTFANPFEETAPIGGLNYKVVRAEISLNDDEITSITVTGIQ